MDEINKSILQHQVSKIKIPFYEKLHTFNVPRGFSPWKSDLSPSALYNCSLKCRKKMGIKAPEVKWMSIKRWVTTTLGGIDLPEGVYLSIKREERFVPEPRPQFLKTEYILLMFPYGNVWSQSAPGIPITEDWMWEEVDGKLILERLIFKDAAFPIIGYFESAYKYMIENPDQIGIHLKRKKRKKSK